MENTIVNYCCIQVLENFTMTTEREFAEWPEKIRRVRGQAPQRKPQRSTQTSRWLPILLFFSSLAIALWFNQQLQQRPVQSGGEPPAVRQYQL
ncbi:hypothetical protein [Picosynechococcus sp. PCC 7003]|uniref:hypothetical protein n=1 Tax=Picosynechococcus sp. PCC 7003 TaxID=374981 RepID=UPI0018DDE65D|nr:hypothetical protein [Picosynechococcus sp. PCC 7003]